MNYETAKKIDLVDYLSSIGFQPARIHENDYWYLSPFNEERTPSFKINRNKNVFYCHSNGFGGTIIDFAMRLYQCDVSGALAKIEERSPHILATPAHARLQSTEENHIQIISATRPITSAYLLNYLESRCIDLGLAQQHFYQVRYENKGREYLAIGFKNDLGGFELRSTHFKGSSAPKAVTFIDHGFAELKVIEGSFSYASLRQLQSGPPTSNFLILNSLSLLKSAIPIMLQHERISLYLDADKSGRKATMLLSQPKDKLPENLQKDKLLELLEPGDYSRFTDETKTFAPYKDANEQLKAMNSKINKGRNIDNTTKGLEKS